MSYSIVFSSRTGNTRMLAETIRDRLTEDGMVYFGEPDPKALDADRLYVGFWTDRGVCCGEIGEFLSQLRDREVFLFGTAGFGEDPSYFDAILQRTKEKLDGSVRVAGGYMCQGKMPMSVRERYVKMQNMPGHMPNLEGMIRNFDAALSHPDSEDLRHLTEALDASI